MDMKWTETLQCNVDWLNITLRVEDLQPVLEALADAVPGFDPEKVVLLSRGLNNYKLTYSYSPAGYSTITFSCSPDWRGKIPLEWSKETPQPGLSVSISGDGIRFLNALTPHVYDGFKRFCRVLNGYPHETTRIDPCLDVFDSENPIVPLFQEFGSVFHIKEKGHVDIKGKIHHRYGFVRLLPVLDTDTNEMTNNVYIGDRTSVVGQCCVYNKKMEVKTGRLKAMAPYIFDSVGMTGDYWYRIEYRLKKGLAEPAFQAWLNGDAYDAFYYAAGHLFTFVDLIYDRNSISKCPIVPVWVEFLEFLASCKQNSVFV